MANPNNPLGATDEERVSVQMQFGSSAISDPPISASAQLLSHLRAQSAGIPSTHQQMPYHGLHVSSPPNYYHPLSQNAGYSSPLHAQNQTQHNSLSAADQTGNTLSGRRATPSAQQNSDRTTSLLSLLKFSGGALNQSVPPPATHKSSAPTDRHNSLGGSIPPSASEARSTPSTTSADLMTALMGISYGKPVQPSDPNQAQADEQTELARPLTSFRARSTAPPPDTQQYLLNLINRKPAQSQSSLSQDAPVKDSSEPSATSDVAHLSQAMDQSAIPISEPTLPPSMPRFTFQSPFDELHRLSRSSSSGPVASPAPLQILKHSKSNATGSYKRNYEEQDQATDGPSLQHDFQASNPVSPSETFPDTRTELEALVGIDVPNKSKETVAEALNEVGEVVNKQVEAALEEAEKEDAQSEIAKDMENMLNAKNDAEFEASAQIAARAIKKELDKDGNEYLLQDNLPTPVADAVKEIIDEAAQGSVADNWESADAENGSSRNTPSEHVVKVYNFPMKPFITLTISLPREDRATIRSTMSVARLKKDFDQIDRTLVVATDMFMIYCMPKTGGIRIIHQGNGNNSRLFNKHDDRIFSIAVSASGNTEVVMGTGVSNTVYWAVIAQGGYDEDFVPETKSFALPPSQTHDGEFPGVLKTRVRKSGSHSEFFAVGRGKSIHIIQPDIILEDKSYFLATGNCIVDTQKYLNDHTMIINTGKAGKDFVFSPDDTMIASLDKSGRVKLWDIRPFTKKWISPQAPMDGPQSSEINEPLMSFVTTSPSEKSWATSVLFVDKEKPYQKGGPLRYLIIGMKQNHTLQLWDLALGRAVQEINLPHENESDAVCSVLYHPHTSIIVVGHPTRNSIYFIHLSVPKYNLSKTQNQAQYVQYLVSADASTLIPASTAVMSGIREFSFSTGDDCVLRSLEILGEPTTGNVRHNEPAVLFELYAMHSKGMTCIPIKRDDLGWGVDNRVLHPVDAQETGKVEVQSLKAASTEPSAEANGSFAATSGRNSSRLSSAKETVSRDVGKKVSNRGDRSSEASSTPMRTANPVTKFPEKASSKDGSVAEPSSSNEKPSRIRRKKNMAAGNLSPPPPILKYDSSPAAMDHSTVSARKGSSAKLQKSSVLPGISQAVPSVEAVTPTAGNTATSIDQEAIANMVRNVIPEITCIMQGLLEDLYTRIEEDRRIMVANGDVKHEAVLRIIFSQLGGDGLQRFIDDSVRSCIHTKVLPAVVQAASNALDDQLGSQLASQINKSIPAELQKLLPGAIFEAHQHPVLIDKIATSVARSVLVPIENLVIQVFEERIMPALIDRVDQTAQNIAIKSQRQAEEHLAAQFQALIDQSKKDNAQIASLTQMVTQLSNTVSTMAEVQSKFQEKYLAQQNRSNGRVPTPVVEDPSSLMDVQFENALEAVKTALHCGRLEDAFMAWLESGREEQLFRTLFSRTSNLDFLSQLSPLVLITVGCVVTHDLIEYEPLKKLEWIEKIFQAFPIQPGYLIRLEQNTLDILPNTISIIKTRLEQFYNRLAAETHGQQTPLLKRLGGLIAYAQQIHNQYGRPAPN